MFSLISSIRERSEIPSTFDGEIPEFAFSEVPSRLRIGGRFAVSEEPGAVSGELMDAAVIEKEGIAYCVLRTDDNRQIITSCPLTPEELAADRRYPDTFFGVNRPKTKQIEGPLDFFDSLYKVYRHTPKTKLLEFLHDQPDFEELKRLPQEELALVYCERLVYAEIRSW